VKYSSSNNIALRRITILISVIGLFAIFLLATSISSLGFKPGQALATTTQRTLFPIFSLSNTHWWTSFCVSILLAMLPIGLIMLIFSKEARKLFKRNMKGVLIWLAFFMILQYLNRRRDNSITFDSSKNPITRPEIIEPPSSIGSEISASEVFIPPDLINWQVYLIGFFLIILIGLTVYYIWERNRSKNDPIRQIAFNTLRDVYGGRQWEDAIIQCYAQMSIAVSRQRRLDREVSMTPGEFAKRLEEAGLPANPINKLTLLFERARYGIRATQTDEAHVAIECLTEIVHALEVPK